MVQTVKGFGIVSKAEIDVFLELSCFFHDPADVGNLKIMAFSPITSWEIDGETVATGLEKVSLHPISKKGNTKNAQTTAQLHSSYMLVK